MDGKTHINIYSKGKTKIGRMLSNFYRCEVNTIHGRFMSVEGYWYWLLTGNEKLRVLDGYPAKRTGKNSKIKHHPNNFEQLICNAITNKIFDNKKIYKELEKSELPFDHYYIYGGKRVCPNPRYEWITNHITTIRNLIKFY